MGLTAIKSLGLALLLAAPAFACAQSDPAITFIPEQPVAGTSIVARITANMTWCTFDPLVTRSPGNVRIDLRLPNCGGQITPAPPSWRTVEVSIGVLPAGSTEVEVVFSQDSPEPILTTTLRVAAALVPIRSPWLIAALAIALLAFARDRYGTRPATGCGRRHD